MKVGRETLIEYLHDVSGIGQQQLTTTGMEEVHFYIVKDNHTTQPVTIKGYEISTAQPMLKGLVNKAKPDALIMLVKSELEIGTAGQEVCKDGLCIHGSTPDWDISLVIPYTNTGRKFIFDEPLLMEDSNSIMFKDIWLDQILFN